MNVVLYVIYTLSNYTL